MGDRFRYGDTNREEPKVTVACPNCKADSVEIFRTRDYNRRITRETFRYYRCSSCRSVFLHPVPGDLGKYYPSDYYSLPPTPREIASRAEPEKYKIELVREHKTGGRLLEIGPSWGSFCYHAKIAGFDVEAIEMSDDCCRFMNETIGVRAYQGEDIRGLLEEREPYDVVALWHVVEHLPNPWDVLHAVSGKLTSGGILVIAAPNPDAWQFRVQGRFWPHIDAPRHVQLIPSAVLSGRMERVGLRTVSITTKDPGSLGWNIFGWQFFLANLSGNHFVKIALRAMGTLIGHTLFPLEQREGRGSAYTAVFRKEGSA